MNKTSSSRRKTSNDSDTKFAKKIFFQTITAVSVFALVLINSKLPFKISADINNTVKYYLTTNVDFKKVSTIARNYIFDILNQVQTLPASGNTSENSVEEN